MIPPISGYEITCINMFEKYRLHQHKNITNRSYPMNGFLLRYRYLMFMEKVTRIGVSLEPELLEKFDESLKRKGYTSRSEAIRDLVRDALAEEEWKNPDQYMIGTINLIYDHDVSGVKEKLTSIQHEKYHEYVGTTIHVHLDHDRCMEILLVSGTLRELQDFANELMSIKGVLRAKLTMTSSTGAHMHYIGPRHFK